MDNQRRIGKSMDIISTMSLTHTMCPTIHMTLRPSYNSTEDGVDIMGMTGKALRDGVYTTNYYSNFNTEIFQFKDFQLASLFSISAITLLVKTVLFLIL